MGLLFKFGVNLTETQFRKEEKNENDIYGRIFFNPDFPLFGWLILLARILFLKM